MKKYLNLLIIILAFFTINVNAATEKINIKEVKVIDKSTTVDVEEPVLENNIISSNIKFNKISDYITYELTLENKDDCDYTIEEVFDNNTESHLAIEYDYDEKLLQNKTAKLRVTLTYLTGLPDSNNVSLNNLEIKMNLLKPDGTTTEVKITNPNTGDNILLYVAILFISLIGMILVIKKHKIGQLLMLLAIVILPISIYASDKYEVKFVISNVILKSDRLPTRIGSPVEDFLGYNWHVIKSDDTSVTILMDAGEHGSDLLPNLTEGKLAHCRQDTPENPTNCQPIANYTNEHGTQITSPTYSWKKSQVNAYLNDESEGSFLYTLAQKLDGKEIIPSRICDDLVEVDYTDYNRIANSPGYLEEEINGNCNEFGTYKVRLLTGTEVNNLSNNVLVEGKDVWFYGEEYSSQTMSGFPSSWYGPIVIWTLNSYYHAYYGSATYSGYIVRPVIKIKQSNVFKIEEYENDIRTLADFYTEKALNDKKNITISRAIYVEDITASMSDKPIEGWVSFKITNDGVIINDYSLKIRDYVVDYSESADNNKILTKNGNVRQKPRTDYMIDGVKYYDGAHAVYFDPTGNDLNCSSTHYNTTGKTGCMKWYAYSEFEENGTTYVNMIADHNTTQKIDFVTKSDYDSATTTIVSQLGINLANGLSNTTCNLTYGCNANKGPITLLKQLKSDTSGWTAVPNRTDSYEVYLGAYMDLPKRLLYTLNYSSYKARLITYEEEGNILAGKVKATTKTAGWLRDNTSTDGNPARGYYTSSINYYSSTNAYAIGMSYSEAINAPDIGLRPVITLPKSSITLE